MSDGKIRVDSDRSKQGCFTDKNRMVTLKMATANKELHQDYLKTFYRCITEKGMICHDMVEEHKVVYIMSGRLTLQMGNKKVTLKNGEAVFVPRNHLVKELKQTGTSGEPFKGLFLHLHSGTLRKLATQIDIPDTKAGVRQVKAVAISLPEHPFLEGLFFSLEQYFSLGKDLPEELIETKIRETVLILLKLNSELSRILFDFRNQWKPDLKGFMEKNYLCDLSIEQFAGFTGRSLSTFKHDFQEVFGKTPHRWIMEKRLDLAYSLLTQRDVSFSEVYLKAGFKSPTHFATVFKRRFGENPVKVAQANRGLGETNE